MFDAARILSARRASVVEAVPYLEELATQVLPIGSNECLFICIRKLGTKADTFCALPATCFVVGCFQQLLTGAYAFGVSAARLSPVRVNGSDSFPGASLVKSIGWVHDELKCPRSCKQAYRITGVPRRSYWQAVCCGIFPSIMDPADKI